MSHITYPAETWTRAFLQSSLLKSCFILLRFRQTKNIFHWQDNDLPEVFPIFPLSHSLFVNRTLFCTPSMYTPSRKVFFHSEPLLAKLMHYSTQQTPCLDLWSPSTFSFSPGKQRVGYAAPFETNCSREIKILHQETCMLHKHLPNIIFQLSKLVSLRLRRHSISSSSSDN